MRITASTRPYTPPASATAGSFGTGPLQHCRVCRELPQRRQRRHGESKAARSGDGACVISSKELRRHMHRQATIADAVAMFAFETLPRIAEQIGARVHHGLAA